MTEQSKRILAEALELPPIERASLVEEILSSFDFPARREIDALWAQEAEERIDAYEAGKMQASPAQAVFERIEGQLKK
jgi:putative addiction module component (TIGR02574 family)